MAEFSVILAQVLFGVAGASLFCSVLTEMRRR
jgi:hypothetical protein